MSKGNAYITIGSSSTEDYNDYPEKGKPIPKSKTTTYAITVINYAMGLSVDLQSATRRKDKQYYPIRIKENNLNFSIQCSSLNEYKTLKKAFQGSHKSALQAVETGMVRFFYPSLKLDYIGYINSVPEGRSRFEFAPVLPVSMTLFKDNVNTITSQYSSLEGSWKDIYRDSIYNLSNPTYPDLDGTDTPRRKPKPLPNQPKNATQ